MKQHRPLLCFLLSGLPLMLYGQVSLQFPFEVEHEITPRGHFSGAHSLVAADLDGDGRMDIVGAALDGSEVSAWMNTGGKPVGFSPRVLQKPYDDAAYVVIADLNKDGFVDIVAAGAKGQMSSAHSGVRAWMSVANGAWTPEAVAPSLSGARGVGVGDLTGDGKQEIVATAADGVFWFKRQGSGDTWISQQMGTGRSGRGVAVADFNKDGRADVAAAFWTDDTVKLWLSTSSPGEWKERTLASQYNFAYGLLAVDLDGDGDMDIIGTSHGKNLVTWWENADGKGTFAERLISSDIKAPFAIHAGDITGDGHMEVVVGNEAGQVWWLKREGHAWKPTLVQEKFYQARSLVLADVDGDGDLDLIGASEGSGQVVWWENRRIK